MMVIEAEQVTRENPKPYEKQGAVYTGLPALQSCELVFNKECSLPVQEGDYIIQRQDGTYYAMTKDEFEGMYEPDN
jgi:hypothetical protein